MHEVQYAQYARYNIVHENSSILSPHPEKSDVQGFMIDSGPNLSP